MKDWIAPNSDLLPDFIIGGAMKCGTTTLHHIIGKHPDVFIPDHEIGFFDIDCKLLHNDFSYYSRFKDEWIAQSMSDSPEILWSWYLDNFEGREKYCKGEDSTTYLASKKAAERLSIQNKKIKLIFLLRQPSSRCYSNYYHMLRTGRAIYNFEDTIRFDPYSIINRSLYTEQLKYYYSFFPEEQINILIFEDFIENVEERVKDTCSFLGIESGKIEKKYFEKHENKTFLPLSTTLQIRLNRLMRNVGNYRYIDKLPRNNAKSNRLHADMVRLISKVFRILNPQIVRRPAPMSKATRKFLDDYFYTQLEGLDEITGKEILSRWF